MIRNAAIVALVLIGGALFAQPPTGDKLPEQTKLAKEFLKAILKEDYTAAGKEFDATMQKVLPKDKLESTWKGLIEKVGAFKKEGAMRTEHTPKYDFVFISCEFEKAPLDLKVVFDGDKKITGFGFVPPKKQYDFKPPSYAKPESFAESKVTVGTGEWALPATLTMPKGQGPFSAVVLVHGSGPHDRDETIGPNKPFRDLAWGLASQGIAVLRYEKRTKEHGLKFIAEKDFPTIKEETVDDALAAVAMLRQNKDIDGKKIFVLGHSLGAFAAPRMGEWDPAIAGLILMAGNARPLEDLILEQMTYLYSLDGTSVDKHKEEIDKIKKQVDRVKDPKLAADAKTAELPLGVPAPYWLALRAYDQTETAAKIKQPMFILQGERDYQVTMADFAAWNKALVDRKNVQLKSYPKLNHLFMEGVGKAKPDEYEKAGYVAKEVVDDIATWVKRQ
ncbi:MAG TPA: alpha/beta fold hydrolase [Gemmataceae bacterium]|nr:alpha/beta fold hydrolase [Gemmataceae bacterium]